MLDVLSLLCACVWMMPWPHTSRVCSVCVYFVLSLGKVCSPVCERFLLKDPSSHCLYLKVSGITAVPPAAAFHPPWVLPPCNTTSAQCYDFTTVCRHAPRPLPTQAFTKLVDKQGPPPAPLPAPTTIPPFPAGAKGTEEEAVTIPTWEEVGFKAPPTTPFKVGTMGLLAHNR